MDFATGFVVLLTLALVALAVFKWRRGELKLSATVLALFVMYIVLTSLLIWMARAM